MNKMRVLCTAVVLALGTMSASAQILIGQTAGMTGSVAASVNETIAGAQLLIDATNAQGGIGGEKIEVLRMDDAFDVKRAGENARVLIEDKKVVALFMSRGTPHSQAIIPWLDKNDVALIGPSTGAMVLHKPVQKHVFNVRSSYQREAEKAVAHLLTIGVSRIAVVHVTDSFGKDALEGAMNGFNKAKATPAATVPADRDKPDYAAIVPQIVAANAQAVVWIGSGTAVVDGVKALRAAGSAAQVVTLQQRLIGLHQAAGRREPRRDRDAGVPQRSSIGHPMVKEALTLARAKGQNELSPAALEGFASAKVLSRRCAAPARSRPAPRCLLRWRASAVSTWAAAWR